MQNIDATQGVAQNCLENKRPNILRKKRETFQTNKSTSNSTVQGFPLLLSEDLSSIDRNITQSSNLDNDLNGPYSFSLSETLETPLVEEINNSLLSNAPINSRRVGKTFPRKRRSSQRIILDTYVCDKTRLAQQNKQTPAPDVINVPEPSPNPKEDQIYDAIQLADAVSAEGEEEEEAREKESGSDVAGEGVGVEAGPGTALVLDAGLESAGAVRALRRAGLAGREQRLLVRQQDNSQRLLWLCPMPHCQTLYAHTHHLHNHILMHFNLNTFSCNTEGCNKSYISQTQLEQHQAECHQAREGEGVEATEAGGVEGAQEAESLPAQRRRARNLVAEALASVGVAEDLLSSQLLPDGSRCWPCPQDECHLTFKTHYLLKNHLLAHYDLRPFKCTYAGCAWAFRSLGKLRVHWGIHSGNGGGAGGVGRYPCPQAGCRKGFSTKYNLGAHVARAHAPGASRGVACPARGCTHSFPERAQLEVHLTTQHVPQHAVHRCGICGKRFWWSTGLAAHARTHAHPPGELLCAWPGCGRRFPQPSRLRYHLRSHTGDKPYHCTYPSCNWSFPSASKLQRHARAHAGEKGRHHVCGVCGRAFLRAEHLREHLPRHLPHRHHTCDHPGCGEMFSNKSSVYVHKKRQHSAEGTGPGKPPRTRRGPRASPGGRPPEDCVPLSVLPQTELCAEELLSLRSARTDGPWAAQGAGALLGPHTSTHLHHHTPPGCEEKQGNPLVCGGLELEMEDGEGAGGVVGAELCLAYRGDADGEGEQDVGEGDTAGLDLNINSLLLQEDLSDGILYTAEEETDLQVLLLSEHSGPGP